MPAGNLQMAPGQRWMTYALAGVGGRDAGLRTPAPLCPAQETREQRIARLRLAVQQGTYRPDLRTVAARLIGRGMI